jgi:hypothetical protein
VNKDVFGQDKDADYHLQSIRSALVREQISGIPAVSSALMIKAVHALKELGMTEDELVAAYRDKFPQ